MVSLANNRAGCWASGVARVLILSLPLSVASADDEMGSVSFNGFGSFLASQVIDSANNPGHEAYSLRNGNCPCYITDYFTGDLLNEHDGLALRNDTRLGLQVDWAIDERFSFVFQGVARMRDNRAALEWFYLNYQPAPNWRLQLGRQRIPLYFYSTAQDVGFAYPWARAPQSLYGWESNNYNGLNVTYNRTFGDFGLNGVVFGGSETVKNSGMALLYSDDPSYTNDVRWDKLMGVDIDLSYGDFSVRANYLSSENYQTDKAAGLYDFVGTPVEQTVVGLSLRWHIGDWDLHLERSRNRRDDSSAGTLVHAPASLIALGYQRKGWKTTLTWSRYWEESDTEAYHGDEERFTIKSLTVSYDLSPQSTLKAQLEEYDDQSEFDFVGDTRVMTLSYDFIF